MKSLLIKFSILTALFISCVDKQPIKLKEKIKPKLYKITIAGRDGLIDSSGKIVVNPQFDNIVLNENDDELICVRLGTKIGFINRVGQFVINPSFNIDTSSFEEMYIHDFSFSAGFAGVKQNGLYGFINNKGEFIIKPAFEDCSNFKNGLAAVYKNKKWGYIDKSGKMVIEPIFDYAADFDEGIASIGVNDPTNSKLPYNRGYINMKGRIIWQPSK